MKLTKAEFILLTMTAIWGLTFPLIKGAVAYVPPFAFLSMRFFLAVIVLSFFLKPEFNKKNVKWGLIIGFFLFAGMACQTIGLMYTKASRSGFITGFLVFLVPLFDYLIFKKKPTIFAIIGVFLALGGLYLLSSPEGGGFNIGDFLTLLSAGFFAFQVIFIEHSTTRYNGDTIVFFQIASTFIFSFIASTLTEKWNFRIDIPLIVAVIVTGVFATALALLMQGKYQKETTTVRAGIIYSMEPVFALFFSFLILSEKLPEKGIIGGFLVFSGMLISNFKSKEINQE
ncbi:DMT family transporter [Thermotomaculum hydrothermale]|uniref:DMT family transporter n=1 Tax=Thermotomaculum hydrothermale TaxID=981385 RepID=UPI001915BD57|nr:DMT family transporter [Thermotomaculum hydrothermale]